MANDYEINILAETYYNLAKSRLKMARLFNKLSKSHDVTSATYERRIKQRDAYITGAVTMLKACRLTATILADESQSKRIVKSLGACKGNVIAAEPPDRACHECDSFDSVHLVRVAYPVSRGFKVRGYLCKNCRQFYVDNGYVIKGGPDGERSRL
jgi:hypothetical protein